MLKDHVYLRLNFEAKPSKSLPLQHLCQDIPQQEQPQSPPQLSFGSQALRVRILPAGLLHERAPLGSRTDPHRRTVRRSVTQLSPFECATCQARFARKNTLKTHERTHTGEKPYVCATCGSAFSESGNLRTHEKIHVRRIFI